MKNLWRFLMMVLIGLMMYAILLTIPIVSIIWVVHHFAVPEGP